MAFTRRNFLATAGTIGATSLILSDGAVGRAQVLPTTVPTVLPADRRYASLVSGYNYRFTGTPEGVRLPTSADEVRQVVQEAVIANKRIAVRSGGHCLENFVADPAVAVVVDLSQLSGVQYDPLRRAFSVGSGTRLGELYEVLFRRWGVTVPGGVCTDVGVGGHISGGGYGALSRLFGLVVDYLYAVEVVVVDALGIAKVVVATSDPADPNRELWWAHTGGGGGNFGVVTRYWLRGPSTSTNPADLLPAPPQSLLTSRVTWSRATLNKSSYINLISNFNVWHEQNSAPGAAANSLFATLWCHHVNTADPQLIVQVDAGAPNATALLDGFVQAVGAGVTATSTETRSTLPWLFALHSLSIADSGAGVAKRIKNKAAYLRTNYTAAQLDSLHHNLTRTDYTGRSATMLLAGYGGAINAVAPGARAIPQRDSVVKAQYSVSWSDPVEDAVHINWVRTLYRDLFTTTGGVPVTGPVADGSYINYPDVDLADPAWNTSGVPWQTLYYKGNYARLQEAKKVYDPRNVFHHALSVRLPGAP